MARGYNPQQTQSDLGANGSVNGSTIDTTINNTSKAFTIHYPIERVNCEVCNDDIGQMNLAIREHATSVHNIKTFNYECRICAKSYESINSIKAHYVACKRQANLPGVTLSNNVPGNNTTVANNNVITTQNPLQCIECLMKQIDYYGRDMKSLVTHMRTKHAAAYEKSKKVATKRVSWSPDEDHVLAELEIKLKKVQKGQLLSRLVIEYNKCAAKSKAPSRTKDAIRTRRQQREYKTILHHLSSQQSSDSDDDSDNSNSSQQNNAATTARNINNLPQLSSLDNLLLKNIHEFLDINTRNSNIKINLKLVEAINGFKNQMDTENILDLTMLGIDEELTIIRNNESAKSNGNDRDTAPTRKPIRNARRRDKANQFEYYQQLYYRNKKKLVAEILDGATADDKPPPMEVAEDYYKNIWSRTVIDNEPISHVKTVNNDSLFKPITMDEVRLTIFNTKKDTAAGPDLVTLKEAKLMMSNLCIAFNIWLGIQRIPKQLKVNKTILLPKGNSDLNLIKNWRPITISSVLLRIYNRLLAYRMNEIFKTNDKQVGFKPVNGCGINISWLHSLLKHARLNKTSLYACLVDVSKAFDSVSHHSIIRALHANGASSLTIKLIMDQYNNISTKLVCSGLTSNSITISSGVKQGDPLSSLLFNLVIDELFDVLQDNHGYSIDNIGSTNARCFADDLTLISSSRIGMNKLLELTSKFFKARGLEINPSKCMSIGLAKGYKGKKSKIEFDPIFSINNDIIPMLGFTDNTTRYLGIHFTSIGAIDHKRIKQNIYQSLEKLERLKLKAQCKIDILRTFIIPRFIFQLIHTELYPKLLIKLDILIRKIVKQILHLPISTSNEFFYIPMKEGGLQLTSLREAVGLAKVKLHKKIMNINDPVLHYLIDNQKSRINEHFIRNLQIGESCAINELQRYKEQYLKEKRMSFANKIHGVGYEVFSTSPLTNKWIQGEIRTVSTRSYINSIKLRTNTLETRVTTTRGLYTNKTCRRCQMADESLMHILQWCPTTKGLRYTRHHRLCERVAKKLTSNGYTVYRERSYLDPNNPGHYLRPDLIGIKDNHALILDVTVVYEITGATFVNAYKMKTEKYKSITVLIQQDLGCGTGELHGLVIGARGSIHHSQTSIWQKIGFSNNELMYLAIGCMEDSLRIFSTFSKTVV